MTVIRQNFRKDKKAGRVRPRSTLNSVAYPMLTPAQNAYMKWLRGFSPHLYKYADEQIQSQMQATGLGFDWGGVFSSIAEGVGKIAPTVLQLRQQRDMLKIQTQRAKEGQPPIDTTQYQVIATPTPQANVVVPNAPYPVRSSFNPAFLIGGALGLGLLIFLMSRR